MANLSSGTQKRPGERDAYAGSGDANGSAAKRSRRESPAGDWRDVHLKEKERDRDRDKRSSRRRDDDYYSAKDRDYRRRRDSRSKSRSRSAGGAARHLAAPASAADDEKEEGEISPRPNVPPVLPSSSARAPNFHPAASRYIRSPRTDRRRDDYPRRSPSRSRSRSRSTVDARHATARHSNIKRDAQSKDPPSRPSKDVEMRDVSVAQEDEQEPEEEKPIEEILAERRRKRAAILAKHASGHSSVSLSLVPSTPQTLNGAMATPSTMVGATFANFSLREGSVDGAAATQARASQLRSGRESVSPPPSDMSEFALAKEDEGKIDALPKQVPCGDVGETVRPDGDTGQLNAADYDPSLDRREDEKRRFGVGPTAAQAAPPSDSKTTEPMTIDGDAQEEEEEEVEVTDDEGEDEVDDMFALAFGGDEEESKAAKPKKKVVKRKVKKGTGPGVVPLVHHTALVDSAADHEGYYTVILGEYLDGGRYQVFSSLGKGMFANVVRARVLMEDGDVEVNVPPREVAIKIIRCQEPMYKAGLKEAQILHKLRALDLEDKKHVVKLERTFEHRGHLCLVFENMSMNLREVVKRFGKDVGLNIRAVRAYAQQLFLSLSLLRKANIMHADIKPDNILVNEQKTMLKLCDLGSASDASENDITPYLVSRFYRAPEIILGVPYDPSLDVWSVGCTLYELYTGKILFPGRSNSHMLLLMMELKGRFNNKMIKKAKFGDKYFDSLGNFESVEKDRITGQDVVKTVSLSTRAVKDMRSRVVGVGPEVAKMKEEEARVLASFVDLLDKCLVLDPGRRITPREALTHAFIRG